MQTFKASMSEAERLRASRRRASCARARSAGRHGTAGRRIPVGGRPHRRNGIDRLRRARKRGGTLTNTRDHAKALRCRGRASEAASTNVGSVAGGDEEMTGSVNDDRASGTGIEQDRGRSCGADRQDRRPHRRIVVAAARIGDVVKLITAIAEQTNLLASTRRSRRRGPARPAAALRSWHRK